MPRRIQCLLFCLLALCSTSGAAQPSGAEPAAEPLIVGTRIAPPFVMRNDRGEYSGISIELWDRIANDLGIDYEFREVELQGLIDGLQNGSLDVSVAALTVTAAREELVDFTHPFHTTGLSIAVSREGSAVWTAFKRLLSWQFLLAILALVGVLLLVGFLFWLVERRKNAEMFGGTPAEGIGASFWLAAVTMTTVGYGDKAPVTFAGRVVALIWMFAAIILTSSFTAAIATSLTVSQLATSIQGPQDLPSAEVAALENSVSANYLRQRGISFKAEASLLDAMEGIATGRYDAVVHDQPILQYLSSQYYPRQTQVLSNSFDRQDYGFALPAGSELRSPINQKLLEVIAEDQWQDTLRRYLGER